MNEPTIIPLPGCTPEPLGSYLKALGVLRVLDRHEIPHVRGWWNGEAFALLSPLEEDALVDFFLQRYRPSPVVSPWNGGSGFWDNQAAGKALDRLRQSTNPRLADYRAVVAAADRALEALGIRRKPKEKEKERLLRVLRARMPESALAWFDAVAVLTDDAPRYAPVLGSGGNDGRLDFSANFIQNLERVMPFRDPPVGTRRGRRSGAPYDPGRSRAWLEDALFARGAAPLVDATSGQFHPGAVGGANATRGMMADALVNPWDYVLLIEGILALAGAVARRLGGGGGSRASFPFTVDSTVAGSGTASAQEVKDARGELWLPLWSQPADYRSVEHLLAEGRAQVGRRQARSGLDFARAAAGLGVDRGFRSFVRFGLLGRNGKAYLAAPLGRIDVRARPHLHLIEQLDPWLEDWRRFAGRDTAPDRFRRVLRDLEAAIYRYCQEGGRTALQEVLAAVGRAERALATSPREDGRPRPLYDLLPDWADACDDGRMEFQIARAVASITDPAVGPIRLQLEPIDTGPGGRSLRWAPGGSAAWRGTDLATNLLAVLECRLLAAARTEKAPAAHERRAAPIRGRWHAPLAAVQAFLEGRLDEGLVEDLIWGLATLRWEASGGDRRPLPEPAADDISRAYAALKLLFWPGPLRIGPMAESEAIPPDPVVLGLLRAERLDDALERAYRRLWAHGLVPLGWQRRGRNRAPDIQAPAGEPVRLAASLIIPVDSPRPLAMCVLRPREEEVAGGRSRRVQF